MKGNQFDVSASWGPRAETPAALGERMLRSLDELSAIQPLFGPWWVLDHSKARGDPRDLDPEVAKELPLKLDVARPRFTEVVEEGVTRDDYDDPEPESGYSISASNTTVRTSKTVWLRVHGGGRHNTASFETAYQEFPDPSFVTFPVIRAVLLMLIANWRPERAQANCDALGKYERQLPWPRLYDMSWMQYLSAPLARQITPPLGVTLEHTSDGGLLMIAAQDTFDVWNPEHMDGAQRIVDAMKPFNDRQDEQDDRRIRRGRKTAILGRLLNLSVRSPDTDQRVLNNVSPVYRSEMKALLVELLSSNKDEESLRHAWRAIGEYPPTDNIKLRKKFETFLSWLQ